MNAVITLTLGMCGGWGLYLLAVYLLDGQAHSGRRRTGGAR